MNSLSSDQWEDAYDDEPWDDVGDETAELVSCPECGQEIYEEAEQCVACGNYVIHRNSGWNDLPVWWIVLGMLGVVMTVLSLILA
jgi:uncharacterized protein (DUF983 family)